MPTKTLPGAAAAPNTTTELFLHKPLLASHPWIHSQHRRPMLSCQDIADAHLVPENSPQQPPASEFPLEVNLYTQPPWQESYVADGPAQTDHAAAPCVAAPFEHLQPPCASLALPSPPCCLPARHPPAADTPPHPTPPLAHSGSGPPGCGGPAPAALLPTRRQVADCHGPRALRWAGPSPSPATRKAGRRSNAALVHTLPPAAASPPPAAAPSRA
jgi:hypothetical protein